MPSRKQRDYFGATPRLLFSPADLLGHKRIKGVAQNVRGDFTVGQSHRRTSGGKAVPNMAYDFRAKRNCFKESAESV
jgi:hypothetical protein